MVVVIVLILFLSRARLAVDEVTVSVRALTAPLILATVEEMVTVSAANGRSFVDSLVTGEDIVIVSLAVLFFAASLTTGEEIVTVSVNVATMLFGAAIA